MLHPEQVNASLRFTTGIGLERGEEGDRGIWSADAGTIFSMMTRRAGLAPSVLLFNP